MAVVGARKLWRHPQKPTDHLVSDQIQEMTDRRTSLHRCIAFSSDGPVGARVARGVNRRESVLKLTQPWLFFELVEEDSYIVGPVRKDFRFVPEAGEGLGLNNLEGITVREGQARERFRKCEARHV